MKLFHVSLFLGFASQVLGQSYWYETISKQGKAPYNPQGSAYQVYRNVKDFGAKGDGVTDDTAAINAAIRSGSRCAAGPPPGGCQSATTSPAMIYFPAGTYIISTPVIPYYLTQMIGNPNAMPVLKATAGFTGIALVDADPYESENPDYGTTNVFYRQIRNIVFDLTSIPATTGMNGIHWPTAQATSLQNCVFKMSTASGSQHVGMFIENGSGGFLTDLTFYGGKYGLNIGSQQFTTRNLTFYNSNTAIYQIWNWGWTYMGVSINNCGTGLDMTAGGTNAQEVGSVTFIDSTIANTPVGFRTSHTSTSLPKGSGSLALENVVLTNVPTAVQGPSAVALTGTAGTMTIGAWVQGNAYTPTGPTKIQNSVSAFPRPASLLSGGGNYYYRSKPQYANLPSSSFSSVRSAGAKGDGVTDDTAALQAVINSATSAGKIVYVDSGIYKITSFINIPPGAKIVGEAYPTIMASGSYFQDMANPVPVVRVGVAGDTGVVELSDLIISTQGACAGATLIQWNLASPSSSPSGMWDVHTRIGGFAGSNLQVPQCATGAAQPNTACYAAFMSMRITSSGSGVYMENVWLWTADHDLDDSANANTRVTIYSGRGLSVESTVGNIWLIGTAVEHHALFQYQFANTQNIFMGFIQTETPYYQPSPSALVPFPPVASRNDPDFATFCAGKDVTCNDAWGLRILSSKNILVYGAGLYSFFNNYSTTCSDHTSTVYNEICQTQIFGIDQGGGSGQSYTGSTVYLYGLATVGSVSMVDLNGKSVVSEKDNTGSFASVVGMFRTS
ncbi:pectate lyase superfamily protein-domain-containing protein [Halenospora varia]|nr:pectate lyase superfamily protein-domain-containing protein [Halenospora varia]